MQLQSGSRIRIDSFDGHAPCFADSMSSLALHSCTQ
jgi:hypothetical protein